MSMVVTELKTDLLVLAPSKNKHLLLYGWTWERG